MKIDIRLARAVLEAGIDACKDMKRLHPDPESVAQEDQCIKRIEWMLKMLEELAPVSDVIYDRESIKLEDVMEAIKEWQ